MGGSGVLEGPLTSPARIIRPVRCSVWRGETTSLARLTLVDCLLRRETTSLARLTLVRDFRPVGHWRLALALADCVLLQPDALHGPSKLRTWRSRPPGATAQCSTSMSLDWSLLCGMASTPHWFSSLALDSSLLRNTRTSGLTILGLLRMGTPSTSWVLRSRKTEVAARRHRAFAS